MTIDTQISKNEILDILADLLSEEILENKDNASAIDNIRGQRTASHAGRNRLVPANNNDACREGVSTTGYAAKSICFGNIN